MLLSNNTTNCYSIGLPLWLEGAEDLSTGYIQGITLACAAVNYADPHVRLVKYVCEDGTVNMSFQLDGKALCSLSTAVPSRPITLPLQAESEYFISGYVTLIPGDLTAFKNLTGAVVNPKYVHFISTDTQPAGKLKIADHGMVYASAALNEITTTGSENVDVTVNGSSALFSDAATTTEVARKDTAHIYSINGERVVNGKVTLTLSNDSWTVSGNGLRLRIGINTETSSCPDANYIEDALNPGNYDKECPLDIAFTPNGNSWTLDIEQAVNARYNSEYERSRIDNGPGLRWNELSPEHDLAPVNYD